MNFTAQSLAPITARTLVVHGDRDRYFPVDIPVNLYRSIPNAALWIIPGGDHVPIYTRTIPFTATALRFLDDRPTRDTPRRLADRAQACWRQGTGAAVPVFRIGGGRELP